MIMQTAFRAGEGTQRSLRAARQDKGRDHTGTGLLFSRGDAGTVPGPRAWTDVGTGVGDFCIHRDVCVGLVDPLCQAWR